MKTLRETFLEELKDSYDSEHQILQALPKMIEAAEHEELKNAFAAHLEETKEHVERLERVFEIFGESPERKKCKGTEGLLEEGAELIEDQEGDAALIAIAQKVEHYEIAAYGSLATWATLLDEEDAADLLEATLGEEKAADETLTEVADNAVNPDQAEQEESV